MTGAPDAVRIAVTGAGLICRRHAEEVAACPATRLAAVVDPALAADAVAARYGVPRYRSLAELLEPDRPTASSSGRRCSPSPTTTSTSVGAGGGSRAAGRPVDLPRTAASRPRLGVSPPT